MSVPWRQICCQASAADLESAPRGLGLQLPPEPVNHSFQILLFLFHPS